MATTSHGMMNGSAVAGPSDANRPVNPQMGPEPCFTYPTPAPDQLEEELPPYFESENISLGLILDRLTLKGYGDMRRLLEETLVCTPTLLSWLGMLYEQSHMTRIHINTVCKLTTLYSPFDMQSAQLVTPTSTETHYRLCKASTTSLPQVSSNTTMEDRCRCTHCVFLDFTSDGRLFPHTPDERLEWRIKQYESGCGVLWEGQRKGDRR